MSTNMIQTDILERLRTLANEPNDSRNFERGLDLLKMKLAQIVRSDRIADVWEDLVGELAYLEGNTSVLVSMMEKQKVINMARTPQEGWFTRKEPQIVDDQPVDRISKVIRNVIVAQEYLGDEIKELKKLSMALSRCINKDWVLKHEIGDDLEDKIYIEITRKLRGEDESTVVENYLKELTDIYKIDLFNEGKYPGEEQAETEKKTISTGLSSVPKLDDLDDLKSRFEALKK